MLGASPRRRRDRARAVRPAHLHDGIPRQELDEVLRDADRPHARTAAAVRNAERLVKIQMADVRADVARTRQADHRVHVRAVEVHLAAVLVNDRAHVGDRLVEHAVRRRIRDHERREHVGVLLGLRLEVGHVDVAGVGVLHDDDLHAGHHGARRIRPVRGLRDQTDVALRVVARFVIRANHQQAGVLALRARVRLQRHGGEAGDLGERALETIEHLAIALRLLDRRERMDLPELGPGHRIHLGRRVQLHRARAERNHRRREREIAVLETLEVPQHLGFRVIAVEDLVRQERRRASEALVVARIDVGGQPLERRRGTVRRSRRPEAGRRRPPASPSRRARCTHASRPSARRLMPFARAAPITSVAGCAPISTQIVSK